MTPAEQAIADLDAALAQHGERIEVWRLGGRQQVPVKVSARAFVRGYSPTELVGGITQQDARVIMSPTEITRTGWPGPATMPEPGDRRVPRKGDKAVIVGRLRNIEAATGIYMDDKLVRIEMRVLG